MIIPIGRTNADRPLGRAADFCPFCRGVRPFRIFRVENFRHVFYVAYGSRDEVGLSKVCETCSLRSAAKLETYAAISTDYEADLEGLIAETNPEIRRNWASRLLLEDRIKARKLTPGERAGLLREPFEMASAVLARRDEEARLDPPSTFGCLGTFFLPVACLLLLPYFWKSTRDSMELVVMVVGGSCAVFTFLAIVTDARRHARRAVLPRLVDSLRPLDPSVEEIELILQSLRQARSPLAEVVTAREVSNRLMERWE
jgi:hypothetical protein